LEVTFKLRSSIFCTVREPFDWPLCVFYSAALSHMFALVGISGEVRVHSCQGVGDSGCVIAVSVPPDQK
jgi:hypothetical protein